MTRSSQQRSSPEAGGRAVRLVLEQPKEHPSQRTAISAVAPKFGCTEETLRRRVGAAERQTGQRPGPTRAGEDRMKALERENRELSRTNEIIRKASAHPARTDAPVPGLDRPMR